MKNDKWEIKEACGELAWHIGLYTDNNEERDKLIEKLREIQQFLLKKIDKGDI